MKTFIVIIFLPILIALACQPSLRCEECVSHSSCRFVELKNGIGTRCIDVKDWKHFAILVAHSKKAHCQKLIRKTQKEQPQPSSTTTTTISPTSKLTFRTTTTAFPFPLITQKIDIIQVEEKAPTESPTTETAIAETTTMRLQPIKTSVPPTLQNPTTIPTTAPTTTTSNPTTALTTPAATTQEPIRATKETTTFMQTTTETEPTTLLPYTGTLPTSTTIPPASTTSSLRFEGEKIYLSQAEADGVNFPLGRNEMIEFSCKDYSPRDPQILQALLGCNLLLETIKNGPQGGLEFKEWMLLNPFIKDVKLCVVMKWRKKNCF